MFKNSAGGYYTYDAADERMRRDFNGGYTEYQYLNGQVLAEKHSDGTWSDYIYANGQKIARADDYNRFIQFTGSFSNVGNYGEFNLTPASSQIDGQYVIQSGDKLMWEQHQSNAYGGIYFFTTDGSNGAWDLKDQNGEYDNDSMQTDGNWHARSVDLSAFAGKTVSSVNLVAEGNSPAGSWTMQYADIAIVSASGTVMPIYNGATSVGGSPWGTSGYTVGATTVQSVPSATGDTVYFTGDQVGSARLVTSSGGWPISSDTFYPFGQEQVASTDPNNYKFATLERDRETGLDHAMFRQYSSVTGRWMSPDPYNGSYDLSNPQSFNRYGYVGNSPLGLIDPSGLQTVTDIGGGCYEIITHTSVTSTIVGLPVNVPLPPQSTGAPIIDIVCYDVPVSNKDPIHSAPSTPVVGSGVGIAPSNGINTKHLACAADAAINFGLGFIPGYNAAKLIGQAAGLNFNFVQNGLSGKSIITAGPTPFSGAAALGSAYSLIKTMNFNDAGGMQAFTRLNSLTGGSWNNARTAINELEGAASTAGTVANLLNTASAAYDIYQCYQTK